MANEGMWVHMRCLGVRTRRAPAKHTRCTHAASRDRITRSSRACSMKNRQSASGVSAVPARRAWGRMPLMISSCSSSGKRPGMLPDESRSFITIRKRSSVTCQAARHPYSHPCSHPYSHPYSHPCSHPCSLPCSQHPKRVRAQRGGGERGATSTGLPIRKEKGHPLLLEPALAVKQLQVLLEV